MRSSRCTSSSSGRRDVVRLFCRRETLHRLQHQSRMSAFVFSPEISTACIQPHCLVALSIKQCTQLPQDSAGTRQIPRNGNTSTRRIPNHALPLLNTQNNHLMLRRLLHPLHRFLHPHSPHNSPRHPPHRRQPLNMSTPPSTDPFIFIDCEMTGLSPSTDSILSLCCYITSPHLRLLSPTPYEAYITHPPLYSLQCRNGAWTTTAAPAWSRAVLTLHAPQTPPLQRAGCWTI